MKARALLGFFFVLLGLLLIDPITNTVTVAGPPEPPQPPPPPAAVGVCDNVRSVAGFQPRFMAYDKVVQPDRPRFGPEVKGRATSEVLQELTERLCTDDALLRDLTWYDYRGTFGWNSPARRQAIQRIGSLPLKRRDRMVSHLLKQIGYGTPHLESTETTGYVTPYYQTGATSSTIPALRSVVSDGAHSDFLVYAARDDVKRYLRLQCGFQPTRLLD